MEQQPALAPELQALLGKTKVFSNPYELGVQSIRRFALAVGDNNPAYLGNVPGQDTTDNAVIAPPTLIFEFNHDLDEELSEEDGGHKHFFHMLPSFKPVFVRGGNEYEFYQPVKPEDKVSVKQEFAQIFTKQSKSGTLTFVIIKISYTNQKNELLGINWETWIFPPTSKIDQEN